MEDVTPPWLLSLLKMEVREEKQQHQQQQQQQEKGEVVEQGLQKVELEQEAETQTRKVEEEKGGEEGKELELLLWMISEVVVHHHCRLKSPSNPQLDRCAIKKIVKLPVPLVFQPAGSCIQPVHQPFIQLAIHPSIKPY